MAKGVRRTSSRFGARLEPFMVADLQLVSGRTLDVVTQAVAKGAYGSSIAADYGRYTVAAAMTETAEKLTDVDGEAGTAQYNLLVGALASLSRGDHAPELILDSYLLRALATGGWAPSFTRLRPVRRARARTPRFPRRWAVWSAPGAGRRGPRRRPRKPCSCWVPCSPATGRRRMPPRPFTAGKRLAWWPATCSGTWNES